MINEHVMRIASRNITPPTEEMTAMKISVDNPPSPLEEVGES